MKVESDWTNPPDLEIKRILKVVRRIAVVGLSSNPVRPSFEVAKFLQSKGYEIIPINPNEIEVLEKKAYPSLSSVSGPIDLIDCFRRSDVVGETVEEGLSLGIKNFWLQEGVRDLSHGRVVCQKGGFIIMDRCIAKEYTRLMR